MLLPPEQQKKYYVLLTFLYVNNLHLGPLLAKDSRGISHICTNPNPLLGLSFIGEES